MEADILAFAQQVCTDAYVEGRVASAEAELWGFQLAVAISIAVALAAFVTYLVLYKLSLCGRSTDCGQLTFAIGAGLAMFVAICALAATGGSYQDLLAWQIDPVTQAVKDIAVAI